MTVIDSCDLKHAERPARPEAWEIERQGVSVADALVVVVLVVDDVANAGEVERGQTFLGSGMGLSLVSPLPRWVAERLRKGEDAMYTPVLRASVVRH